MKVIAFNGSARKDGNTSLMIRQVFSELEKEGIQTHQIQLAGETLRGCTACYKCFENKNGKCAVSRDKLNDWLSLMLDSDGIILASPTYFADISSELKALIDRAGMASRASGDLLKRKVGAAIVVARRGGPVHAFDSINHFFFISQMIVPGSNYWNMGLAREKGEVEKDLEAMETMRVLGRNMAWLLKKINQ